MKKKPYDVYSPEIYPRLLFVSTNIEDLDKYFIFLDVYGNNDGSEYNQVYIRKTLKTAMKRMPIQQDGLQEI